MLKIGSLYVLNESYSIIKTNDSTIHRRIVLDPVNRDSRKLKALNFGEIFTCVGFDKGIGNLILYEQNVYYMFEQLLFTKEDYGHFEEIKDEI